ncbi:hypothetical protein D3C80_991840 [compost metagenome]
MTGKKIVTALTIGRQRRFFTDAKDPRLLALIQRVDILLVNIAQQMLRVHEVIAVIQIAIGFQRKRMSAGFSMHAQYRRLFVPGCDGDVKHLH